MSHASVQGLLQRPGLSSGGFVSTGEPLQDSVYSSRGQYEDPPSSSRPRPVGGSTGAQLHHLTQMGLSSQMAAFPGVGRSVSGPTGSSWNQQHSDQDLSRPGASRESVLSFPEFSSSVFQMPGSSLRDAPPPDDITAPRVPPRGRVPLRPHLGVSHQGHQGRAAPPGPETGLHHQLPIDWPGPVQNLRL
ncbi:hypothetical protein EPR50_G00228280, partial [Perca flavescens]